MKTLSMAMASLALTTAATLGQGLAITNITLNADDTVTLQWADHTARTDIGGFRLETTDSLQPANWRAMTDLETGLGRMEADGDATIFSIASTAATVPAIPAIKFFRLRAVNFITLSYTRNYDSFGPPPYMTFGTLPLMDPIASSAGFIETRVQLGSSMVMFYGNIMYAFSHWNTEADGSGTTYWGGFGVDEATGLLKPEMIVITEDTILYAQYFRLDGGNPIPGTLTLLGEPVVGETLVIKVENCNATGGIIPRWLDVSSGTEVHIASNVPSLTLTEEHIGMEIVVGVGGMGRTTPTAPVSP